MRSFGKNLLILSLLIALSQSIASGQIIFKEIPGYQIKADDSLFFDMTSTRSIIPLNGKWAVFPPDDPDKKVIVNVPSIFKGKGELVFQKSFTLTEDQINNHNLRLYFFGLNYTADISVNNVIIYRHSGGEFPFDFVLPRDILRKNKNNVLSVKLLYELDSENTIPVKQMFLYPQNFGGILKDVYLKLLPNISISDINITRTYYPGGGRAVVNVQSRVENKEFRGTNDSLNSVQSFSLRTMMYSAGSSAGASASNDFEVAFNKDKNINQQLEISSPALWSPSDPSSYILRIELWRGDRLIDVSKRIVNIFSLVPGKDSLLFNGSPFSLNGVCYTPSYYDNGSLCTYDQMEKDIKIIKEAGFNTVKFSKTVPHPYYLYLCGKYGLLCFVEIPLSSIPASLTVDPNFITRSKNYIINFLKGYKNYTGIAGIGLGNSYLPELEPHRNFIQTLADAAKKSSNALIYASFAHLNLMKIPGLDLYGIELFNQPVINFENELKQDREKLGSGSLFISSATYVVNKGNSDGYVNEGSYEAQAKYFEDMLEYQDSSPLAGFFINSMFDYRGQYHSLIAGYTSDNIYHIGIAGENRDINRIAYKVISSKLHNAEKVTIPIGSKKDNAPMMYIIFGLLLALFMGVLVNSGRKFREDSSRALLRPYNFFADVRDQRIMSGPHTTLLMVVVSAVAALIISNVLSYLKEDLFFENLLLSFGSRSILQYFSYLAWHPFSSLVWFTIIFMLLLIVLTIIVKIGSFFVKNKVYLSSVYFSVVWSFLPLVLLIPVGIILYRLLNAHTGNLYIMAGLLIFAVWIFYRLMKGIYVIFDVTAGSVYFYSLLLVVLVAGGILFYYEINNSVIDYIQLTIKQFNPGS